jgi:pimeloyl-ACP methyl ester carboxylesterase
MGLIFAVKKMVKPYLHYRTFGSGQQVLIAFHGFGQDSSFFAPLANAFPQYTIYGIDLFFHGESHWPEPSQPLLRENWQQLIADFLTKQNISRFDLIGFSMGGRIALVTYELFAPQISRMWLLAPDGIKTNAWYRIATRNRLLHSLFRYITAEDTNIFHYSVRMLEKRRLLHPMLAKLAQQQMRTPELRKRVYNTWMLYRYLEPDLKAVSRLAHQYHPQIEIATGKYDRVIRPHYMKKITDLLGSLCTHHTFTCGHQGVMAAWIHSRNQSSN